VATSAGGDAGAMAATSSPRMLSLATTPSALEPLTILPRARILPGSMLRLLGALLPTLRSDLGSPRDRVIEPPVLEAIARNRGFSAAASAIPRPPPSWADVIWECS